MPSFFSLPCRKQWGIQGWSRPTDVRLSRNGVVPKSYGSSMPHYPSQIHIMCASGRWRRVCLTPIC